MRRSREPILWVLFGGGGMMSALFLPALLILLFIASPLGWVELTHGELQELVGHPLVRLGLFGFVFVCFFHAAHRGRYTLYDGLQLSHLNQLIAVLTYGVATALTAAGAYVLWTFG